jgi:hypothetical protein
VTHASERLTFAKTSPKLFTTHNASTQQHAITFKEARIQIALKAIQQNATMTQHCAALTYNISQTTLSCQLAGTLLRRDCTPNSMKLSKTEEEVVVQHILDLDVRGFPPHLAAVKDMADSLLVEHHQDSVGQKWAANFVKRQPELKVKFNRKYDYKRALCKDPEVIQDWFKLVENTKAKYGIQDEDTYNFNEAGFMMGMISTGAVVTGAERRGRPKSVQQGNREWTTVIQGVNATGWAISPFIIFQGKHHLSAWYKEDYLPQDWVIAVSENGWTTSTLTSIQRSALLTRTDCLYSTAMIATTRSNSSSTVRRTTLLPSACLLTLRTCCSHLM